jgi:type IV secretion system protein VirB10
VLAINGLPVLTAQDAISDEMDEYTIPEGTEFKLQLHTTINSKTSKVGDRVLATLLDPVYVEDREVLPKGMRIDGHVNEVKGARRKGKGGYIYVIFDTVELPNGEKVAILGSLTEIFAGEGSGSSYVGVEGDLRGGGASRLKQLTIASGSTAAGAAAGVGPGIAAGVGGLILAIVLPRGKQARLSAGSLVGMRLDRDVTILVPAEE